MDRKQCGTLVYLEISNMFEKKKNMYLLFYATFKFLSDEEKIRNFNGFERCKLEREFLWESNLVLFKITFVRDASFSGVTNQMNRHLFSRGVFIHLFFFFEKYKNTRFSAAVKNKKKNSDENWKVENCFRKAWAVRGKVKNCVNDENSQR